MHEFLNPGYMAAMDLAPDEEFLSEVVALVRTLEDEGIPTLFHPWILHRLRAIKDHARHLYYGAFLVPLRRIAPRQLNAWDLVDAMSQVDSWVDGKLGTVSQTHWSESMDAVYAQGLPQGVSPGWYTVGLHYRVQPGDFTVLTGVPSHGKSRWLHQVCINLARQEDWRISVFSPEHHPAGVLGAQLVELYIGDPLDGPDGRMGPQTWEHGKAWVQHHFQVIEVADPLTPTLGTVLQVARQHVEEYGIQGLILDPWNEIDHQYGPRQREDQYVSQSLSQIRRFARTYGVHVWIVAHPTKLQKAEKGPYAGKYPPPTPYDISGAAHWYNKADACLCVWRDVEAEGQQVGQDVEIHVQKMRSRAIGRPGMVTLRYDGLRYHEQPEVEPWTPHA